jgi:cephalosporin-C deacetylase-like acetyl esterase
MISAPEDYGLSPEATLAHRADPDVPEGFDVFWAGFREAISSQPASFTGTHSNEVDNIVFTSLRSVRIAGRLALPEGAPRAAAVTTHGASEVPDTFDGGPEPWTDLDIATLRIRVRGYPPSVMDIDDLRGGWILHNIESPDAWILRGAVADVVQAVRCLRRRFGPDLPIGLHGESLGAGLAVIAAAQLGAMGDPPFRLALGLPSLGDWRWRRGRYCNGSGGLVNTVIESMRKDADAFAERLRLFDAALHARSVACPTLCKLAACDDVVPAPSAASVYNAIATDRKWRFVTRYGHFDGGVADTRRHALFERLHPQFLDPSRRPEDLIAEWSDRMDLPLQSRAV